MKPNKSCIHYHTKYNKIQMYILIHNLNNVHNMFSKISNKNICTSHT